MFKKIVWLWFSAKGKNAKDIEEYIGDLVKNGANEFFTGYNPVYWDEKFWFEISPKSREKAITREHYRDLSTKVYF
jgi:hypothetical protein